jgi:O-acetyl-ADP-ribose deacetylase (regulator of RNase III)
MEKYNEVYGNLITLAQQGEFDVITHGCNCFCTMGAGIAPQMAKAFGCHLFTLEAPYQRGNIDKLGRIDYKKVIVDSKELIVVNSYTQYNYGSNHIDGITKPIDYDALTLCMRKINNKFKGKHIGLPQIGAGLAGGDWNIIKEIIKNELKDCIVTVVIFKP